MSGRTFMLGFGAGVTAMFLLAAIAVVMWAFGTQRRRR